jgi:hypothetical protein
MQKIILSFLLFFILFPSSFAQTISGKLIADFTFLNQAEGYSFRYHPATGSYFYADFDTVTKKSSLYDKNGKAGEFDFVMSYSGLFDENGNYFVPAGENITDTTSVHYLIVNGKKISRFDYISEGWKIRNGKLYFTASENSKSFLAEYDITTGTIRKNKFYDFITLISFPEELGEGEPVGEVGFMPDGKPFYLAEENNLVFIVLGETEMKHYADINPYSFKVDAKGNPVYIAKSEGKFYARSGNTFVVQGDKEYKKYDFIYPPIFFDKSDTPVYTSEDSVFIPKGQNYYYPQRVMIGNKECKTYNGGVYFIKFTPSGKLAYLVTGYEENSTDKNITYLVIEEKVIAQYSNISDLKFIGETPLFSASKDGENYFVVYGNKEYKDAYQYISFSNILSDGRLAYIGTFFGNFEKKQSDRTYLVIDGKKSGPYETIQMINWKTGEYLLSDKNGNYAFVTSRITDRSSYEYKQTLHTKDWESKEFTYIDNVVLREDDIIYTTNETIDKTSYQTVSKFFVNDKQIGGNYDLILDFTYSEKDGTVNFVGLKNKLFYYVTVTF